MSMETFLKIREMGKEIKDKRKSEEIDFDYMTTVVPKKRTMC